MRPGPKAPILLAALLLAGCSTPAGEEGDAPPAATLTRLLDVHGLAVDPERPGVLLVATHEGLARHADGAWTRVSREPLDLMGFALHPTDGDVAWASGHPPGGGALGIVKSTDGGVTWQPLAMPDKDYHALAVSPADPQRLWGFLAGVLHRSDDGGATWRVVSEDPPAIFSLRGGPTSADVVFAATSGGLARSLDGGASWSPLATLRAFTLALHADGTAYAAGEGAWRSADGGETWTPTTAPGRTPVGHLAVDPTDARVVYAATRDAGVYRSGDGGESWTTLMEPAR